MLVKIVFFMGKKVRINYRIWVGYKKTALCLITGT